MGQLTYQGSAERTAFNHSATCDGFFSMSSPLPGGVEHRGCLCWCHGDTGPLFTDATGPEYDLTPPPEYATSADVYGENENDNTTKEDSDPFSDNSNNSAYISNPCSYSDYSFSHMAKGETERAATEKDSAAQNGNRSREELQRDRCDTCGDSLKVCECVE